MPNKLTNIPVTPSDEMLDLLKDWVAPDVTEVKRRELDGKTNFMGVPINEMYSRLKKEEAVEEEEIPQLTAAEIEKIRQDAYEEGFSEGKTDGYDAGFIEGKEAGLIEGNELGQIEGHEQGLKEGQVQIDLQANKWQELIEQLYQPIKRVDKAAEMQLLDLAVMLAEAVIRTETQLNKGVLLNILHESVASLPFNTEYCEIHLHPDDIETIKAVYDEEALVEQKWILKEEPGYQQGDLIVGTPNSLIDRTLKHRLKQTIGDFVYSAALDKEHAPSPVNLSGELAHGINDASGPKPTIEDETDPTSSDANVDNDAVSAQEIEPEVVKAQSQPQVKSESDPNIQTESEAEVREPNDETAGDNEPSA
jgi:flagellar assembly protein FliH